MLNFEKLLNAHLSVLKTAVDDWNETVKRLEKLEEQATKELLGKASKADWAGENAGVTLPFVRRTAKEFGDAAKEAASLRNILRDALAEFEAAQKTVRGVAGTATSKGLHITPDGNVEYLIHPDRRNKDSSEPLPSEGDFAEARSQIKTALAKANEADEIASRALRMLVGKDRHNFSGTEYDSLKEAGKAQDAQDAEAAAKIVAKGDDASPTDIARLNKYLTDNKGDKHFAESFALEVGARRGLNYWVDLGDPSDGSRLAADHADKLKDLQKNWSLTLASATHSHSPAMEQWKAEAIKSGDEIVRSRGTSAYGFQVMSNLMRHGEFDAKFLRDYGNAVMVTENKMTRGGAIKASQVWDANLSVAPRLNWDGKDLGRDPATGFMEALGHNPKASTQFFNSKIDLTPESPNNDKKLDAFKYLTQDRGWLQDAHTDGRSNKYGYDSLGHALEAATTGRPYDAIFDGRGDVRSEENAKVMQKVVNFYGSDPKHMHEQGIADSLAKMGSAYIDEFNRSLEQENPGVEREVGGSPFGANREGHSRFGEAYDVDLLFTRGDAIDFMSIVSQDETGHAQLSAAQSLYTTSVIDAAAPSPGAGEIKATDLTDAKTALRVGAEAHGVFDNSRMGQIDKNYDKETEEYNKQVARTTEWIKFGTGMVIGGGVAAATGGLAPAAVLAPLAAEYAGGAVETYLGTQIDSLAEKYAKEDRDLAKEKSDDLRDEALLMGKANALAPGNAYADAPGWSEENSNYVREEFTKYVKDSRIHAIEDPLPDPYEKD
ncbi:hypothetical protein [Streptomyces sp. NPDC004830]